MRACNTRDWGQEICIDLYGWDFLIMLFPIFWLMSQQKSETRRWKNWSSIWAMEFLTISNSSAGVWKWFVPDQLPIHFIVLTSSQAISSSLNNSSKALMDYLGAWNELINEIGRIFGETDCIRSFDASTYLRMDEKNGDRSGRNTPRPPFRIKIWGYAGLCYFWFPS
jgi:hypothetical protein